MPRVNRVTKCRKSPGKCSKCGETIRKDEPYVWWAFMVGGRGGPKIVRCGKAECQPKRSELTRSAYYSALYDIQDTHTFDALNADDLQSQRDEAVEALNGLKDETQEKFDNMPSGLQEGDTGQQLQERVDALESAVSELEGIDISAFDTEQPEKPEKPEKGESTDDFNTRVSAWEQENEEWQQNEASHYDAIQEELAGVLSNIS